MRGKRKQNTERLFLSTAVWCTKMCQCRWNLAHLQSESMFVLLISPKFITTLHLKHSYIFCFIHYKLIKPAKEIPTLVLKQLGHFKNINEVVTFAHCITIFVMFYITSLLKLYKVMLSQNIYQQKVFQSS